MSESGQKSSGAGRKRKYQQDGTPLWSKRVIDGPGVWVSCVKGKEKQTVGELYDLFESLACELWPENPDGDGDLRSGDVEDNLEDQIAKEIASMKRPRKEQRFASCQTNTPCVVFIGCKPPIDPVKLVLSHIDNVKASGITHTNYTHRLVPVSDTCLANVPEIQLLCQRIFKPFFEVQDPSQIFRYKVEARIRNHTTLDRQTILQEIAKCVPEQHKVDLTDPEVFILVEVFKSVCGISIVKDYYSLEKFNVVALANSTNGVEVSNPNSRMGETRR